MLEKTFFFIKEARTDLRKLQKDKNHYRKVKEDLEEKLNDYKTFDQFFHSSRNVRPMGPVRIIKMRVANSLKNEGSSGGYRFVWVAHNKQKVATVLMVYPKTGPQGQSNYTSDQIKDRIKKNRAQKDKLIPIAKI